MRAHKRTANLVLETIGCEPGEVGFGNLSDRHRRGEQARVGTNGQTVAPHARGNHQARYARGSTDRGQSVSGHWSESNSYLR